MNFVAPTRRNEPGQHHTDHAFLDQKAVTDFEVLPRSRTASGPFASFSDTRGKLVSEMQRWTRDEPQGRLHWALVRHNHIALRPTAARFAAPVRSSGGAHRAAPAKSVSRASRQRGPGTPTPELHHSADGVHEEPAQCDQGRVCETRPNGLGGPLFRQKASPPFSCFGTDRRRTRLRSHVWKTAFSSRGSRRPRSDFLEASHRSARNSSCATTMPTVDPNRRP